MIYHIKREKTGGRRTRNTGSFIAALVLLRLLRRVVKASAAATESEARIKRSQRIESKAANQAWLTLCQHCLQTFDH